MGDEPTQSFARVSDQPIVLAFLLISTALGASCAYFDWDAVTGILEYLRTILLY